MKRLPLQTLLAASLLAPIAHADSDYNALAVGDAIPGRYIVVFEDATTLADALGVDQATPGRALSSAISKTLGAGIAGEITHLYGSALLGFAAPLTVEEKRFLEAHPLVDYVEADHVVGLDAQQRNATWGLDRTDQRSGLDSFYSWGADGAGAHAYILDTGIRASHNEFSGRIGEGADFGGSTGFFGGGGGGGLFSGGGLFGGGDSSEPAPYAPSDCNGHGTHVAGTVGGTLYGMAKNVTIHAVRVLGCGGVGSASNSIAGLDWVVENGERPAVVNMSLGGSGSEAEDTAVRNTVAAGVTVVAAAGNDDADACSGSPGREPSAITVASTDQDDHRSGFSNWGPCVDLFAPGGNIRSASYLSDSGSDQMSGTSMAAPHVAGAAAQILSASPGASPGQVWSTLRSRATTSAVNDPKGSPNLLLYNGGGGGEVVIGGDPGGDPTTGEDPTVGSDPTTGEEPAEEPTGSKPGKGGGKGRKK